VTIYLDDSHGFIPNYWRAPLHLVLIDACHCKHCATTDFLNIEPHVEPGGIVMFHDFGEDNVGQGQPLGHPDGDVRGACRDLRLLDNKREHWVWISTIIGPKERGTNIATGASDMGVFQRT
jgi:hypothetical protein